MKRRFSLVRPPALAALLAAGALHGTAARAAALQTPSNGAAVEGEAGLWVRWRGNTLAVSWITRDSTPGLIEILAGDRVRLRGETPAARQHTVALPRAGSRALLLRYGAATGNRHETLIRPPHRPGRNSWGATDSIVVVSDIHGELDRLTQVLRNAGVLDAQLRWSGGRRHLVVLGDMVDRGPASLRTLWFLYGLEPQAEQSGGRVHVVLGNHELMVMSGDLRYATRGDHEIARLHGVSYAQLLDPSGSVLGRWLLSRPPALRIGDVLFAHGGISGAWRDWSLDRLQDSLRAFTHEELFVRWNDSTYAVPLDSAAFHRRLEFLWGDRSVFWYRGYVQADSTDAELRDVLDRFDARLHVVGHTPLTAITTRFDGALIAVNTFPFVTEALLLVRDGRSWQRYRIRETGPPQPL